METSEKFSTKINKRILAKLRQYAKRNNRNSFLKQTYFSGGLRLDRVSTLGLTDLRYYEFSLR